MGRGFLIFLFTLFCMPHFAWAQPHQQAIGALVELEGNVLNQNQKLLDLAAPIYLHDTITTGKDARALILFIDDTTITLGENSSLTIDEYIFDPTNFETSKGRFNFGKGVFEIVSGYINKTKKPDVGITTPYGSIGIRGTTVWGGEIDGQYQIMLKSGLADIINHGGITALLPGQSASLIDLFTPPSPAQAISKAQLLLSEAMLAFKDPERMKRRLEQQLEQNDIMRNDMVREQKRALEGFVKSQTYKAKRGIENFVKNPSLPTM